MTLLLRVRLGFGNLQRQPAGAGLAVVGSREDRPSQVGGGKVTPNGEVDTIEAYFFDRIDVRLDRTGRGAEDRVKVFIGVCDGAQKVRLVGTTGHCDSGGGHGCYSSPRAIVWPREECFVAPLFAWVVFPDSAWPATGQRPQRLRRSTL